MSHADILDIDRGQVFRRHVDKESVRIYRDFPRAFCVRAVLLRKRTHDLTQNFCVQTAGCRPVVDPA